MCAACIEYTKDTLKLNEFKSALRETTREDAAHLREVEHLIQESGADEQKLKKSLRELAGR